jgi:peptidoglycan lytic transglycosylase
LARSNHGQPQGPLAPVRASFSPFVPYNEGAVVAAMGLRGSGMRWRLWFMVAVSVTFAACSTRYPVRPPVSVPSPVRPGSSVVGVASWYGPGFNGRQTADGEIYNQEDLTAASNIFPLGTDVMVTNLSNGRAVEVRINDRGPFRKHRLIDLSHKAARVIGMIGPGTAVVRMDVLSTPDGILQAIGRRRYFIQVGAFSDPDNARRLAGKLSAYYSDVQIDKVEAGMRRFYRVRMGGFTSRSAAETRAARLQRLGLPMVIVSQ